MMGFLNSLFGSLASKAEEMTADSASPKVSAVQERVEVPSSADEEMRSAIEAANQSGRAEDFVNIGLEFSRGNHVQKDEAMALHCFKIAAQKGDVDGQFLAGMYTFDGSDEGSRDEAAEYFKDAAHQGKTEAMYMLGVLYLDYGYGWGKGKGYDWILKAAERGHAEAQARVGIAYSQGQGYEDEPDHRKACFWCVCAYLQNDQRAKSRAVQYLNWASQNIRGMNGYIQSLMKTIPQKYPQYVPNLG